MNQRISESKKTTPSPLKSLQERWQTLGLEIQLPQKAILKLWSEIAGHYQQPRRAYHNLSHLQHMFTALDVLEANMVPETAVQLAVYYHDIVIDPQRQDNEQRSAAVARQHLQGMVDQQLCRQVERLILLTRNHSVNDSDITGALLVDADLAILGAPAQQYKAYALAVRQEYQHLSHARYLKGRKRVLDRFLERPFIYHTSLARRLWEQAARQNLRREIVSY